MGGGPLCGHSQGKLLISGCGPGKGTRRGHGTLREHNGGPCRFPPLSTGGFRQSNKLVKKLSKGGLKPTTLVVGEGALDHWATRWGGGRRGRVQKQRDGKKGGMELSLITPSHPFFREKSRGGKLLRKEIREGKERRSIRNERRGGEGQHTRPPQRTLQSLHRTTPSLPPDLDPARKDSESQKPKIFKEVGN